MYLFEGLDETFFLCRAEWKPDEQASQELLDDTAYILLAFKEGKAIFPPYIKNSPLTIQEVKQREEKQ